MPSMDFETYSEAGYVINGAGGKVRGLGGQGKGGLPVVGTPAYAAHPSTEVLCLYYDLKDGRGRRGWFPGSPDPVDLLDHIRNGGPIEAFNATFEFWIWNMVCVRRYGWPPLPIEQCYCVMARARRFSLPGSLANVAKVLGTPEKDKEGGRLIQKLTRPHTPTKLRPAHRWTPATAWPDFAKFYAYCDRDVETEDHAAAKMPDLTEHERAVWLMDQTINARGVPVDIVTLDAALEIQRQAEAKYCDELSRITGGAVKAASELPALKAWLSGQGVEMPDMTKGTIDDVLANGLGGRPVTGDARRTLEIRQTLGAANVKKLAKIKLQVCSDGRLRNQYMYCGADRTGRWSSAAADDDASNSQLQNVTAKGPKSCKCAGCGGIFGRDVSDIGCPRCGQWVDIEELPDWTIEGVEAAIADIRTGDLATVERMWGDPIAVLCGCLRGLFKAAPGKDFICCDFSAIEALAAACLARCQWRIDVFSGHGKIYEQSAANATGIPFEEILQYKIDNGMHHPARKKIGKVRELAGGYGGWINAWCNFGADEFMTEAEIKTDVLKWRAESPEIEDMWGGQFRWCGPGKWDYRPELFGLEGAAIQAILQPGQCFSHTDITYGVWDDILFCRLPSGRYLHYHRPRLTSAADKLNRGPSYQITFEGYNSNSTKGPIGWHRLETYGGRLFENVVQAVSLDIQADALLRCESRGYPIVMHTHDEGVAEVPHGFGSVEEMVAIMSERPAWAAWWPLRAAGWRHERYQKD
jgi:DNA polymerase